MTKYVYPCPRCANINRRVYLCRQVVCRFCGETFIPDYDEGTVQSLDK